MRRSSSELLRMHTPTTRGPMAGVALLFIVGCGRFGYELLSDAEAGGATPTMGAGGASGTGEPLGAGGAATSAGGGASSGGSGSGGDGMDAGGSSGGTDNSGAGGVAGSGGGGAGVGGVSGGGGGSSANGGTGSASAGTSTTAAGGGTTGTTGTTGATGTTGTGGTGGTAFAADLSDGYWVLDASDSGGQVWTPSTLLFTSATGNPDGTISLSYRIDWFEDSGAFGILLGGEEFGTGTFDPSTNLLVFDQTGGWSSETLDHYEANYSPVSDSLDGFWDTGNPGTFSATRELSGRPIGSVQVQTTSQRNGFPGANMLDADMMTYWSSGNGATVGEVLTLTWPTPMRLRGLRLLAIPGGNDAIPARVSVSSRDAVGTEVDSSDLSVPPDPMWKPLALTVDTPVVEVRVEITEVTPAGGTRVVVTGLEVFGVP